MSKRVMKDSRRPSICEIEKDSKRSWFVCLGASLLVGLSIAVNRSFAVLFVSLLDEFHDGRAKIVWIGSFEFIWYMLISPVCDTLTRSFGFRAVVFVGTIFFSLGLFLTSLTHHIAVIYVTYGLLLGTGTCLLYIPALSVLPYCFHIHLCTAYGIAMSANSFFTMLFGPMYEYLIRKYGWRMALKILTVLIVPLGFACLFFPKKGQISLEEGTESKDKLISPLLRTLKNPGFVLWILIMSLVYLAAFIPFVHLISFSQDIGIPTNISVYALSVLCVFDGIGRLMIGRLLDYFHWDVFTVNSLVLLAMAVACTFLPLTKTVVHLFLFASFYGLAFGVQCVVVFIISPQLCQAEDAKQAIAYLFAALSIPGGVGPAIPAWIYDATQSYHISFFVAGGFFAVASVLGILLPFLIVSEGYSSAPSQLRCENTKDQIIDNKCT